MRGRVAGGLAAAVLVLASCGSDSQGRFDDEVAAVRQAVEQGDPAAADQALEVLAGEALEAHQEGEIDEEEVQEVADLIDASRIAIGQLLLDDSSTSTTSTTPTTAGGPPPWAEGRGDDDDKQDEDEHDEGEGEGGRGNGGEGRD